MKPEENSLISIGLAIYNGAQYIRENLNSILAQKYRNFELIISDDASTDKTQTICQEYAAKDQRIRYYRNSKNWGMYKNFKKVFDYAKREFFLWVAHDDIWHPAYLKVLLSLLLKHETAVLAGCQIKEFLPDRTQHWNVPSIATTLSMSRVERITEFVEHTPHAICHLIYGLFRREFLAKSNMLRLAHDINDPTVGFDHLIVFECLDHGDIVISEQSLFFGRIGGESYHIQKYATLGQRFSGFTKFTILLFQCFQWSEYTRFEGMILYKSCCLNTIRRFRGRCRISFRFHIIWRIHRLKQYIFHPFKTMF